MRRFILLLVAMTVGTWCGAQFHPYYNPYYNAMAAAEAYAYSQESIQLNNIRFDERALQQNPDAWNAYQEYLAVNSAHLRKYKGFETAAWTGLGLTCAGLVPMMWDLSADGNGTGAIVGGAISGIGTIVACVGLLGLLAQDGHIKSNKKEFIYYLRTTNNGVGIVTLF